MDRKTIDPTSILSSADRALIEGALRGGTTRREVMGWLIAAGMGMTAAGSIVTNASRALADTPKKGGRIRVAGFSTSTADTVDPAKQTLSTDYSRCNMFYNGLTVLDEHLAPQLALAESIESDEATVWTIKLLKGVHFHDGKELNSADVVYSLMRHKDPKVGSIAKTLAQQIAEVKATGPNEVKITLSAPNADLPVVLGTFHFHIIKDGTTDFATAVGTGPYKCKEFSPGIRSIAVRNENYWKEGKPFVDEIEFIGIPDASARVNALLSGDVQLIGAISPRATKQVKSMAGFKVFKTPSGNYTDLVMRQDADPVKNPDFVKAMKYMFNREQIRSTIFQGYAVIGNDQPIDPSNRFYCPDIPQTAYDPEKAKFHLQKAGLVGTTLPIYASPAADNSIEMAELLQQTGAQVGLTLDIKKVPADGYWSNYWMKQPLGFGNINPRPSADILLTLFFKSDAPWNESGWKHEKFDQLLATARAEGDDAKHRQMYYDMQRMVHDEAGIGIPVFITLLDAHAEQLKGLRPISLGGMMGYNFAESVWLDA